MAVWRKQVVAEEHYPACSPDCGPKGHVLQPEVCPECGGPLAPVTHKGKFIRMACVVEPRHPTTTRTRGELDGPHPQH
jgi:hypothetical protein